MNPRLIFAVIAAAVLAQPNCSALWAQMPAYPPPGPHAGLPPGACDPYAHSTVPTWTPPPMIAPPELRSTERFWFRGEYLRWWTRGMDVPPLVTTSPTGTPQAEAGVLGFPDTTVLFGGGTVNDGSDNGMRFRTGLWLTPHNSLGLEAEYFQLFGQDDSFSASGDGTPILARPFFDITNDRETAQLISFPGLVAGSVNATTESELRSFLFNGRVSLDPNGGATYGALQSQNRIDWILGYRYLDLNDSIEIRDNLESLLVGAPGTIVASESFRTSNTFHGAQLGVVHVANLNRLWLESMLRVAIGSNTKEVRVRGTTAITEAGVTETFTGNLLAQRTNIGTREESSFTMIPEIGLTLGVRLTDYLHATIGYSVLYFPNVVRAGDQIDTDINPNLIPPEAMPFTGSLRPRPLFEETHYWAHGLSLGGELRF